MKRERSAHLGGRPWNPSAQVCNSAESAVSGVPTPTQPGHARSPWSRSSTPTPSALPRPAPQAPPYMTPQAPRRSLPQSVSGPGGWAPPAASSSAGHRVRHLPGSPGTPIAVQSSASQDVAPVRPCAPGRRERCPQLPGSSARGAGADLRPEGRSQGARCRRCCGKVRAVRVRPGRAGQGGGRSLHPVLISPSAQGPPSPAPTQTHTESENFTVI